MRKEEPTFFHQDFCRGGSLIQTSIPDNSGSPLRPGMFSVAPTASGVPVLSPRCRMLCPRALPEGRGPPELGGQCCRPTFSHVALQKMWFWFTPWVQRRAETPLQEAAPFGRRRGCLCCLPCPPAPPRLSRGRVGGFHSTRSFLSVPEPRSLG